MYNGTMTYDEHRVLGWGVVQQKQTMHRNGTYIHKLAMMDYWGPIKLLPDNLGGHIVSKGMSATKVYEGRTSRMPHLRCRTVVSHKTLNTKVTGKRLVVCIHITRKNQ